MEDFGGQNTHIIQDVDVHDILKALRARGIEEADFTNGTFTLPKEKMAPTLLSAFQRVCDLHDDFETPLIVATNSDKSMLDSYKGKENEQDLIDALVPQQERAEAVVSSLSALYPDRPVVAIFYDEDTPYELYEGLYDGDFGLLSLHKNGYGTNPNDKPIIGAELFEHVYAFPLPFDEKPVMYHDTRDATSADRQPDIIEKLTEEIGPHGAPYITKEGKILFPLPASLAQYAAAPSGNGPKQELDL